MRTAGLRFVLAIAWVVPGLHGADAKQTQDVNWRATLDLALEQQASGQIREAERTLLASVHEAEQAPAADPVRLPTALIRLGGLYRSTLRYGLAEKVYRRSADLWRQRFGESSLGLSLALSDLAWVYVASGKPARAGPLWEQALQIRLDILGPVHPSVARIYGYMAVGAFAEKRTGEAERLCRQALAIYAQGGSVAGETDPVMGSLALMRLEDGDLREALQLAERAIALQQSTKRPSSRLLAGYLYTLARSEFALGQNAEASEHFREADRLTRDASPAAWALRYKILKAYADSLRRSGDKVQLKVILGQAQNLEKRIGDMQTYDALVDVSDLR